MAVSTTPSNGRRQTISTRVPTPLEEAGWVVRAQCGDREALELLLRSVQPSLSRYVRRVVGTGFADDIVQDVLITIARKIAWLTEPRFFRAWVYRIASRAAVGHARKEKRRGLHESDETVLDSLVASEPVPSDELLRELLESDQLSTASRTVLVLHFEEGLTLPEVAAVLDIPLGTAKSRLAYGLAALRRHLGKEKESRHGR
jgi:RNA polymerase sigma-70 factor (ECF subfamily)